jgi:hypothetical protein
MLVLLATLASVLVGVRQHSENRRLEYRVWDALRRRDELTRQIRDLENTVGQTLSPQRLLVERDRRLTATADGEQAGR